MYKNPYQQQRSSDMATGPMPPGSYPSGTGGNPGMPGGQPGRPGGYQNPQQGGRPGGYQNPYGGMQPRPQQPNYGQYYQGGGGRSNREYGPILGGMNPMQRNYGGMGYQAQPYQGGNMPYKPGYPGMGGGYGTETDLDRLRKKKDSYGPYQEYRGMTPEQRAEVREKNAIWRHEEMIRKEREEERRRRRDGMEGGGQGRYIPNPSRPTYPPPGPGYIWQNGEWVLDRRPPPRPVGLK